MIEARYTLTEDEYIEAQRYYTRYATPKWAFVQKYFGLFLVLCFVIAIATNPNHFDALKDFKNIPGLTFMLFALLLPWMSRRSYSRRFKIERANLTDIQVTLDEYGYHTSSPTQGSGNMPWPAVTSYGESSNLFLLFKGFTFRVVPKRVLDHAQLVEAERLISSHVPKLTRKLAKAQGR